MRPCSRPRKHCTRELPPPCGCRQCRSGRNSRSTARCVHAPSNPRSSERRPATVSAGSTAGPAHSPTKRSSGRTSGGVSCPPGPTACRSSSCSTLADHYAEPGDSRTTWPRNAGCSSRDRACDPQHRRHRQGARLPVGGRLRTPPLVVHGAAGTDPQLIGSFAAIWDDILPVTPDEIWKGNLDRMVAALREQSA